MKFLTLLITAFVLLFNNPLFSQNDDVSEHQLKFYFNFIHDGYLENRISNNEEVAKNISKFGTPSIAYVWKTNEKKWEEVEFSAFFDRNVGISLTGNTVINGFTEKLTYVSARYERNRILLGADKIDMSLGGSFQASYLNNSFVPSTSSEFPLYYNGLHTRLSIIPRILFKFDHFALDLNMPYSIAYLNLNSFREEVPTLPEVERTNSQLNFELFPIYYPLQVRLGVVVDLK